MKISYNPRNKLYTIALPLVLIASLATTLLCVNLISLSPKQDVSDQGTNSEGTIATSFSYVSFHQHEQRNVDFSTSKEGSTLLVFEQEVKEDEIDQVETAVKTDSSLNAIFLYPFSSMAGEIPQTVLAKYGDDSQLDFGHDDENASLIKAFNSKNASYPYYVTIGKDGRIVSSSNTFSMPFYLFQSDAPLAVYESETATGAAKEGYIVPDFSLSSYSHSQAFHLREDCFNKVTVINFWGTWCGPCVEEMPYFGKLKKEYPDIEVVAIHSYEMSNTAASYLETKQDSEGTYWKDYGINFLQDDEINGLTFYQSLFADSSTYPNTVVLNSKQVITTVNIGQLTYDKLVSYVTDALNS